MVDLLRVYSRGCGKRAEDLTRTPQLREGFLDTTAFVGLHAHEVRIVFASIDELAEALADPRTRRRIQIVSQRRVSHETPVLLQVRPVTVATSTPEHPAVIEESYDLGELRAHLVECFAPDVCIIGNTTQHAIVAAIDSSIAQHAALTKERDMWKRRAEQHGCNVVHGDAECG